MGSVPVFNESLTAIRPNASKAGIVACGSASGQTALISLSSHFHDASDGRTEKQAVGALFDRETKREKILEARQRELKLKERERSARVASAGSDDKKNDDDNEEEQGDDVGDSRQDYLLGVGVQQKTLNEKHLVDLDDLTIDL